MRPDVFRQVEDPSDTITRSSVNLIFVSVIIGDIACRRPLLWRCGGRSVCGIDGWRGPSETVWSINIKRKLSCNNLRRLLLLCLGDASVIVFSVIIHFVFVAIINANFCGEWKFVRPRWVISKNALYRVPGKTVWSESHYLLHSFITFGHLFRVYFVNN
jgi:hypothetical protein